MHTIFAQLLQQSQAGRDSVLVTIVSGDGSTPRGAGSQMLVGAHGRLVGTIGGGGVELASEKLAITLLQKKQNLYRTFDLCGGGPGDAGMVCGGRVSVWLQYVPAQDPDWEAAAKGVLEHIARQKPAALVLDLAGGVPVLREAGAPLPEPAGHFLLPLALGERAVIFGGGHCAQALVPVLASVGFRVTVLDARPEYAAKSLHPAAEQTLCVDYAHISDHIQLCESDYVVVMTNGHLHDLEVEAQVLRRPLAYLGVIGSRKKTAAINERLREMGYTDADLARVHTPIGLAIHAVTPAEIAISIAAEMILERAKLREQAGVTVRSCPMH